MTRFEWDARKNALNLAKRGISFEEARLIFESPVVSRTDDRTDYGERREISIGVMAESSLWRSSIRTEKTPFD